MVKIYFYPFIVVVLAFVIGCKSSSDPKNNNNDTKGKLTGTVKDIVTDEAITTAPAYIYLEDSLLATTDENGMYSISSMEEGTYTLRCSCASEFFNEEINLVEITGGKTNTHDFYLEHLGKLYGEFQDVTLFNEVIIQHPEVADWSAQEIYQGETGATLTGKMVKDSIAQCLIYAADTVLIYVDAWAQYVKMLPVGSYSLRGTCAGGKNLHYTDEIKDISIYPDSVHYVNFYLPRQVVVKLVYK